MEQKDTSFSYTYSAAQQAEIEKIRQKYTTPTESKLDQLRRLDRSASQKAQAQALTLGILGALILGTGMSLIMTPLGKSFGSLLLPVGIGVGLLGMLLVALAYPIYNRILQKERKKIAPEILRLSQELLQ